MVSWTVPHVMDGHAASCRIRRSGVSIARSRIIVKMMGHAQRWDGGLMLKVNHCFCHGMPVCLL